MGTTSTAATVYDCLAGVGSNLFTINGAARFAANATATPPVTTVFAVTSVMNFIRPPTFWLVFLKYDASNSGLSIDVRPLRRMGIRRFLECACAVNITWSVMDFLNRYANLLLVGVTITYVIVNAMLVRETRSHRLQQVIPYVRVVFEKVSGKVL